MGVTEEKVVKWSGLVFLVRSQTVNECPQLLASATTPPVFHVGQVGKEGSSPELDSPCQLLSCYGPPGIQKLRMSP